MATMINDPVFEEELRADRAARGADHYDEVWEGVYFMSPLANDEHQMIVNAFAYIFQDVFGWPPQADVRPGINVSDRIDDWTQNYRVPDVAVFLKETSAVNHDTFWFGGPDFAVEIVSPGDQARKKLKFYGNVGTRELLIVDRNPWQLELFRLNGDKLVSAGVSTEGGEGVLAATVLPFTFRLISGDERPQIDVRHSASEKSWVI